MVSGVIAASGGWICGASAVVCVVVSVDLDSDHDDEVKMNGSGVDPLVVYIQKSPPAIYWQVPAAGQEELLASFTTTTSY